VLIVLRFSTCKTMLMLQFSDCYGSDVLGIELSPTEGVLAARASCDILLTIRPNARVSYRWKISYTLHTAEG